MSEPKGPPLEPSDSQELYRQVSPGWIKEGRVTSQAFSPFPKDHELLSVSLSGKTTPKDCFEHFTQKRGFRSEGVWCITTNDCARVELPAYWAPVETPPEHEDPAHGAVDFRQVSDPKASKTKSKYLAAQAHGRGRRYPGLP
jgi:hypothetical protein